MAISRSQTGKTVKLKPPKHLQHRVTLASSPMEKIKKKKPLLPASKKNFKKYKHKGKVPLNTVPSGYQKALWKFSPDVKQS